MQTGDPTSTYPNVEHQAGLTPTEYNQYMNQASLVVSHAGTGTIFAALTRGLPVIVIPRLAEQQEHRNDHQLATVKRLAHLPGLVVVQDVATLKPVITRLLAETRPSARLGQNANQDMISALRQVVEQALQS